MFSCIDCGNAVRTRFDRCPKCGTWHTCQRTKITRERVPRLSDITITARDDERISLRKDWDRALGGGAKPGSITLIAGKAGAGKTSEMLSLAGLVGNRKSPSLYLSSEREVRDLAGAAVKMSVATSNIAPVRVRTMRDVRRALEHISPVATFLDSGTNLDRFENEDMLELRDAIGSGIAFVICHVTKAQEIAGRNGLSHYAASVVWIRGKTLRTTKNWYGPAPISTRRQMPKFR